MRKVIMLLFVLNFLASCGPNQASYNSAAQHLCTCISHEQSQVENTGNDILIYAKCSAKVEEEFGVSIEDKAFDKAMSEQCNNFLELHDMIKNQIIGNLDYE